MVLDLQITEMKERPIRVALNMIVKNEAKIITRALDSAISIIDTFCICDTGSTDNTKEIIAKYFKAKGICGYLVEEPFVNFSDTRNASLKKCQELTDSDYILLMDADMKLSISSTFNKDSLRKADIHKVLQGASDFYYENVRFIKNIPGFRYTGVTHEYLDCPSGSRCMGFPRDVIFIHDIGDGGCKGDKFTRDIALLEKGLVGEPDNVRYHFYLANSYYDSGLTDKAIDAYKKRIKLGGWLEEVWYSYFRLGLCYQRKGNMDSAISAWLDAYEVNPCRAENIYEITKHYRVIAKQKLSFHFYLLGKGIKKPADTTLFLHSNVYEYLFDYELSIIGYYIFKDNPALMEGMRTIFMKLFNINHSLNHNNIISNYKFYCLPISKFCTSKINLAALTDKHERNANYVGTSPSVIKYGSGYLANVRFVNYRINPQGQYTYYDGYSVCTNNVWILLNKDFTVSRQGVWNNEHNKMCRIRGLEDVKILAHKGSLHFICTRETANKNSPANCGMLMAYGAYDISGSSLQYSEVMSPTGRDCEKNWALFPYGDDVGVVYEWYPLTIGKIDGTSFVADKKLKSPPICRLLRGSSNGCLWGDEIWFVCHAVEHSTPRCYYHCIVILDAKTHGYKSHSKFFTFDRDKIEFCLGLVVEEDRIIMTYSNWDRSSQMGIYDREKLLADIFSPKKEVTVDSEKDHKCF